MSNPLIEILLEHSIDDEPITMIRQSMCTAFYQGKEAGGDSGCKPNDCPKCPLSNANGKEFEETFIKMLKH